MTDDNWYGVGRRSSSIFIKLFLSSELINPQHQTPDLYARKKTINIFISFVEY